MMKKEETDVKMVLGVDLFKENVKEFLNVKVNGTMKTVWRILIFMIQFHLRI